MRKTDVIAPLLTSKPRSLRGSKDFWSDRITAVLENKGVEFIEFGVRLT
jgi:hypothetical protein